MSPVDPAALFEALRTNTLKNCPVCGEKLNTKQAIEWMDNEHTGGHEGWYQETLHSCPKETCPFSAGFAVPYTPPAAADSKPS